MKNKISFLIALVAIVLLSGCADVSHVKECLPAVEHTYGFWGGLWHGLIAPLAFIGELFSDDIAVYAHNNNGCWYDFGFILGIGGFSSGCSKACSRK